MAYPPQLPAPRLIGSLPAAESDPEFQISWFEGLSVTFDGGAFPDLCTGVTGEFTGAVDFRGLPLLTSVYIGGGTLDRLLLPRQVTSININNNSFGNASPLVRIEIPAGVGYLALNNCSLTEAEVDDYLAQLVANGQSNGVVILTQNVAPSATGAAHAATLVARGWTVTTD